MKRIIKELKAQMNIELKKIGLTPYSNFKGTQEQHDAVHKLRANEYKFAIDILKQYKQD